MTNNNSDNANSQAMLGEQLTLNVDSGLNAPEMTALVKLFEDFQENTRTLQQAHERLQARVAEIDAELEQKNLQLQTANETLERKMAELDQVQKYLGNVLQSMNSGVVTVDVSGKITMVNPAAVSCLGLKAEEAKGHLVSEFFPQQLEPRVLQSLLEGERFVDMEELLVAVDGTERFIRTNAAPIHDANGERIGALMIFNDITSVKVLQEKARRQDRLTALGELAAGVAHEMRNPLTTIRGYIQILPTEIADPEFQDEFLAQVLQEIDRLTGLTDSLLDLAKPVSMNVQPYVADELVAEAVSQMNDKAAEQGVEISVRLRSDGARVLMDRNRIKQILLNLLLNAIDAIDKEEGRIGIETGRQAGLSTPDGSPYYVVTFTDNGKGIPGSIIPRLFDPFFTTKESGSGLGLSVSNRIVQEHGGIIRVESREQVGSKFSVLLPLHAGRCGFGNAERPGDNGEEKQE